MIDIFITFQYLSLSNTCGTAVAEARVLKHIHSYIQLYLNLTVNIVNIEHTMLLSLIRVGYRYTHTAVMESHGTNIVGMSPRQIWLDLLTNYPFSQSTYSIDCVGF
jgi:hypothetical protein